MQFDKIYKSKYAGMEPELVNPKYIDLDSNMQLGYKYNQEKDYTETIKVWNTVWNDLMDAMQKDFIKTFRQFDKIYKGTQFVSNWVNDFEDCLCYVVSNAHDAEVLDVYGKMRIHLNEQIQNFIDKDDELSSENAKRAIAETHFLMGNIKIGEKLFENYLSANPEWGWGWIGWSDQYWLCKGECADYKRGEEILLKALNVPGLKDRDSAVDRLLELYGESEQDEKLKALEKKFKQEDEEIKKRKKELYSGLDKRISDLNQAVSAKVGRNEPCPCGSGKKYKKCCG